MWKKKENGCFRANLTAVILNTHAMHAFLGDRCLGQWIRTDRGVRTFQGLGRNGPTREQVVRRIAKDLHTRHVLEDLLCDSHLQVPLHCKCLPDCDPTMSHSRDIQTTFVYRLFPRFHGPDVLPLGLRSSRFPSGGGGVPPPFQNLRPCPCLRTHQSAVPYYATICCGC